MTYASVAAQRATRPQSNDDERPGWGSGARDHNKKRHSTRRSPSPSHVPKTGSPERETYVLTLMTDNEHHARLTRIREQYFPAKLNKLAAHLTLFHALPGSRLETEIVPILRAVASASSTFRIHAGKVFRLKRGMAIDVAEDEGSAEARKIHNALQQLWHDASFLSEQDAGRCRIHYTIMNKVDQEGEVDKAFEAMKTSWKGDWGIAEGLGLWRYDRGFWRFKEKFDFRPMT